VVGVDVVSPSDWTVRSISECRANELSMWS
jgi:hypothetical protein